MCRRQRAAHPASFFNLLKASIMKLAIAALGLIAAFALAPFAHASPQGEKMKACSQDAKSQGLKGDVRKAHMKTCLKGTAEEQAASAAKKADKKAKMKACNLSAKEKGLKGAERKESVKTCLKA